MKHIISIKYKATSSKIFLNLNKILQQFEALYSNYTHSALSFAPSTWTTQSISIRKFLSEPDNLHLHRFVKNQALVTPSEGAVLNPFSPSFCCVPYPCCAVEEIPGRVWSQGENMCNSGLCSTRQQR